MRHVVAAEMELFQISLGEIHEMFIKSSWKEWELLLIYIYIYTVCIYKYIYILYMLSLIMTFSGV